MRRLRISPFVKFPPHLLAESRLQRAMLFELGYTVGEFLLQGVGNYRLDDVLSGYATKAARVL